jgi:hypothetical protein
MPYGACRKGEWDHDSSKQGSHGGGSSPGPLNIAAGGGSREHAGSSYARPLAKLAPWGLLGPKSSTSEVANGRNVFHRFLA